MRLGFTGTQEGMTAAQKSSVTAAIRTLGPAVVIHGDCIGADAELHAIAIRMGFRVEIRPCTIVSKRAYCDGAAIVHPAKAPMDRNLDIVRDSSVMLATPKEYTHEMRSGTWATIRRAFQYKRPYLIVGPDGRLLIPAAKGLPR